MIRPSMIRKHLDQVSATNARLCLTVFGTWPLLTLFSGGLSLEQISRTIEDWESCKKSKRMRLREEGKATYFSIF